MTEPDTLRRELRSFPELLEAQRREGSPAIPVQVLLRAPEMDATQQKSELRPGLLPERRGASHGPGRTVEAAGRVSVD